MAGLAEAYVAHALPGRVRLRIPARRGDARWFAELGRRLKQGQRQIDTNPRTGSVLIRDKGLDLDGLGEAAARDGLFALRHEPPASESVLDAAEASAGRLESGVRRATGGELDLASLAFIFFMVLGFAQLLRGQVSGPATTMFWYAATLGQAAAAHKQFGSLFANGGQQ